MRRLLIIFLVVLLPAQFVWGAAAGYCRHEQGIQSQHYGHHAHEHLTDAVAAPGGELQGEQGSLGDDPDCISCHLSCVTPVPQTPVVAGFDPLSPDFPTVFLAAATLFAPTIDRPNWAVLP